MKVTNPREPPDPQWCWEHPQPLRSMDVDLMYQVVEIERGILLADPAIPLSNELREQLSNAVPSYLVAPVSIEAPPNMRSSTTLYPAVAEVRDHHIRSAPLFWLRVQGFVENPATREDTLLLDLHVTALEAEDPYFANRGMSDWLLCVVPVGDELVVSSWLRAQS
jgi:hypothetical protein